MAQRIPRDESLSRVHGVGALFAAAYGNVGSSIYYALGVTAAFALGLTPVAFVISGLIFAAHRRHLRRGDGDVPGGRRLLELRPPRLQRAGQLHRRLGADAQLHRSRSRSRPSSCPTTWPSSGSRSAHGPGDIIGGAVLIAALARSTSSGTEESARLNLVLAIADLATQVVLVGIGLVLVFSPQVLVDNVHLGVAPTWSDFALGIAVGMIAYTGIETISNMAEEAKDAARTIPRSVGLVVARRARPLPADPDRRALGDAGHPGRRRPLHDRARHRVRRRPDPRHRREPRPRRRA